MLEVRVRGCIAGLAAFVFLGLASPAAPAALFDALFYGFPTGGKPVSLQVRDLDGDGDLDLLTADEGLTGIGSSTLSFIRGHGDGTFDPRVAITTGSKPVSVDAADLDHDGKLDLVVCASFSQQIWVHRGTGPGTFAAPLQYNLAHSPGALTLVDVDADGFLDALVPHPYFPPSLTVKFGGAAPLLGTAMELATDAYTNAASFADLDADGALDLVATNTGPEFAPDSTLALFRNLGGRTFAPASNVVAGLSPVALARGRFNADTLADFAVACRGDSTMRVLIGDGAGSLDRVATFRYVRAPVGVMADDVDGDQVTDLVVSLEYFGLVVHLGNGDGTFAAGSSIDGVFAPSSTAVGDVDGDGVEDLAAASVWGSDTPTRGAVAVLPGTPDGPGRALASSTGTFGPLQFAIGDLDGDATLDAVAVLQGTRKLVTLKGDGLGHFASPWFDTTLATPFALALASLDGNTPLDLVVAMGTSTGYLAMRPGIGDGTFATGTTVPVGRFPQRPQIADLDGNGTLDVLSGLANTDSVVILFTDGLGGIDSLRYRRLHLNAFDDVHLTHVALALVDGDAFPDLAVASTVSVDVYWGSAGGHFTTRTYAGPTSAGGWNSLGVGDVNGDALPDLVLSRLADEIGIIRSAGGRGFRPILLMQTGSEPFDVAVADVTADGRPELLTADNGGSAVSLFYQRADSSFAPRVEFGSGTYTRQVFVTDLNGDARPDVIAAQLYPSSCLSVLLNTGQVFTATTWSLVASTVSSDGILVTWQAPPGVTAPVNVERNADGSGWSWLAQISPDGTGRIRLEDRDVNVGHRYGYRLATGIEGARAETWVEVPATFEATRLAITPSPVTDEATIAFELAFPGEVTFELLDLQGRVATATRLGRLPAGRHRVRAFEAGALAPGVYFARLTRSGGVSEPKRVVVFR